MNTREFEKYVDVVFEECDKIKEYTDEVHVKILDKMNEVSRLIWDIEDIDDTWVGAEKGLNDVILKKNKDLDKKRHYTEFKTFDILDMVKELSSCKECYEGLNCSQHGL